MTSTSKSPCLSQLHEGDIMPLDGIGLKKEHWFCDSSEISLKGFKTCSFRQSGENHDSKDTKTHSHT